MNNVSTLLPSKPQYGKGKGFSIMISFLDESLDLLPFQTGLDILNVIILLDFISIQIEFFL